MVHLLSIVHPVRDAFAPGFPGLYHDRKSPAICEYLKEI